MEFDLFDDAMDIMIFEDVTREKDCDDFDNFDDDWDSDDDDW